MSNRNLGWSDIMLDENYNAHCIGDKMMTTLIYQMDVRDQLLL